jgi:hypothetical protein
MRKNSVYFNKLWLNLNNMITGSKWYMDAEGSSETSVDIYQTTRHYVQGAAIF